jgi:hypothetical protein
MQNFDFDILLESEIKREAETPLLSTNLYAIRDIKVLLGPSNKKSEIDDGSVQLNLFVLHMNHLDKVTCTMSKIPCMEMNIYNLNLFRAVRQYIKGERDQVRWHEQPVFNYKVIRPPSVELVN